MTDGVFVTTKFIGLSMDLNPRPHAVRRANFQNSKKTYNKTLKIVIPSLTQIEKENETRAVLSAANVNSITFIIFINSLLFTNNI